MVNDVITRAGSLFKTIEELFVGNGPFQDKLMSAIGTLLKGVWDIFGPYLELGIGKIIKAVGVATGFETVQSWGDKMMLNAASKNDTVKSFVGSDEERKKMTDNINKK
jgi:hypothetical protein